MDEQNKKETKKGFFARWFEKLDKKLEEKAKKTGCCCDSKKDSGNSCCK